MSAARARLGACTFLFPAAMLLSGHAIAQATADAAPSADAPQEAGDIVVSGRRISQADEAIGQDRVTATVAVTRDALLSAPSGISGLKMLESLPGFNVQTEGALGLYEFGNSVQVRAFNLDQIGFVVDGIPTGRSDAFGGSPIFRYVDNENLAVVEASAGAGGVSAPSYASLGPIVSYRSIAPQELAGVFAAQSFGDYDLRRTFVRLSTGRVGPVAAYVSRTKLDSDLWRGAGSVDREHWEAAVHVDLGGESWARLKFVANDFFDFDSPTLSRADYRSATPDLGGRTGRDRGYIDTVPDYAPVAGGPRYSSANYTYNAHLAINVRHDRLYGVTTHFGLADGIHAETTAYWEDKDGYGVSPDSYANSLTRYRQQVALGQDVVAPRGTQFGYSGVGGDRYGIVHTLHADVGAHALDLGIWAETDSYHRTQLRYNTTDGSPASPADYDEVVFRRRDYRSQRDTTQLFVRDRIALSPALSLDLGIKALDLNYQQRGYRDFNDYARVVGGVAQPGWGPRYNRAHYRDLFLPTAGLLFRLPDDRTQLFASYAENLALPKGMDDIYAVALNSSAAVVAAPAPERAKNAELGIRTNQRELFVSLAGYYTRFDNRIQSIAGILPGTTNVTETFFQNVGRVEAYGVEFLGNYRPAWAGGLAYANLNVTWNNATFLDDIPASPTPLATAGKTIPDSARWIVSGGLTVEPASWLVANVSAKYTSERQSTFVNAPGSQVPGFTVVSAYVDIGDGITIGPVKNVRARLNVDNLFDKDTLSFISPAVTGDGLFRPLNPRTVQVTLSVGL